MLSIVYVSSAVSLFPEDDLRALLEQSRDKNARLGITGMLLYKDGNFMQALEGPEDAVTGIYTRIQRDPRHHGVIELTRQEISEREFPAWSMGFRNLDDVNLQQTPGFSTFLNEPLNGSGFKADPTRAQKLLGIFREKM